MIRHLASPQGVQVNSEDLESERLRAEQIVAGAEASAREEMAAMEEAELTLRPDKFESESRSSPFMLSLPGSKPPKPTSKAPEPAITLGPLSELEKQFTCPLDDILAYADMIGMDVIEDRELLWIADEALEEFNERGAPADRGLVCCGLGSVETLWVHVAG